MVANIEIKHAPILNVEKTAALYTEKDGVNVRYVCTTDLEQSDRPYDIFYRDTPHPEFGNRYFGLTLKDDHVLITDADVIETMEFGMIEDRDKNLWYSQSHHDCLFIDGSMIDGGRKYFRSKGRVWIYKVRNGEFLCTEEE